jgi:thiamine-phosphate pyrophosphorylase
LRTSKTPPNAIPDKNQIFYYITDRKQLSGGSLIACIRRALDWGVDFIQIREKDLSERALFELTCRVVSLARSTKCRILVNGRADIALAAGAHGVHLPSAGLQAQSLLPWVPNDFCIGVSVHSMSEIRSACAQGVDYILVGHLFPTKSKQDLGSPLGLEFLRKACAATSTPILGLGGIHSKLVPAVLEAGAAGVAGIGLFQKSDEFIRLKKLYHANTRSSRRKTV